MVSFRSTKVAACLALAMASSSCAVDFAGFGSDDETASETSVSVSVAPETTAATAPASAQAAALRTATGQQPDLPPDVAAFVAGATDARLDELGTLVCGQTTAEMSPTEFGSAAIVTRDQLTADEQAQLDLAEFGATFRVVAESYCPAQVPTNLDLADEVAQDTVPDSPLPDPTDGTVPGPSDISGDIAGYRAILPAFLPADHAAVAFVEAATDERIDELQATACAVTTPDLTSTDFGFVVIEHYSTTLTDEERSRIGIEPYAEMFGSLIGWFCEAQLPTTA